MGCTNKRVNPLSSLSIPPTALAKALELSPSRLCSHESSHTQVSPILRRHRIYEARATATITMEGKVDPKRSAAPHMALPPNVVRTPRIHGARTTATITMEGKVDPKGHRLPLFLFELSSLTAYLSALRAIQRDSGSTTMTNPAPNIG